MDSVSQRRIAAAVFAIVWAIKIPLLLSSDVHHFGLSCFLDAVFFVALYRASIPWMKISRCGTLLLILGSWILNMGLLGSQSAGEESLKGNVRTIPKVLEGNIIGSHQVHVRPPTIVKLNPNATMHCAAKDQIPKLNVLIKGTPPWIIEINHSLDGKVSKFNLTVNDLNESKKFGSKLYSLDVNRLGNFEISAIYEVKTGDLGKVIPSFAEITKCPEVKWKNANHRMDVCVQSVGNADIILDGVPPLSVWILKKYTSSPPVIDLVSIGSKEDGAGTFSTSVKIPVKKQSDISLKILRVSDGKQNTVDFGVDEEFKNLLPKLSSKASYYVLESRSKFEVSARSLPKIQFSNCESSQKLMVDQYGKRSTKMLRLPLTISGIAPYKINYKLDKDTEKTSDSMEYDIDTNFIEANSPGTYIITSIQDAFCKGMVLEPSACDVIATYPPTLEIASTPIESSCIGAIGLTANLSFTGEPPFWVDVQQELIETHVKKIDRFKNLKTRHVMRFEPSDGNGTYRYSFLKVNDFD